MEFKYVMYRVDNQLVPIIFPEHMVHSLVFEAIRRYYAMEADDLALKECRRPELVSAGKVAFIACAGCYDKSESLGIGSRGDLDANVIELYNYFHGHEV
jgi:hypothetical protein